MLSLAGDRGRGHVHAMDRGSCCPWQVRWHIDIVSHGLAVGLDLPVVMLGATLQCPAGSALTPIHVCIIM